MAKAWRNKSNTIELKGFDELLEKLQEAGKDLGTEGRKCFEHAAENVYDALYEQSKKAKLPDRLIEQIDEKFIEVEHANVWSYEVGWKKQKPSTADPLPDTYKVMFYNYGTPSSRNTNEGGQRVQIDGKWVTLAQNRGKEEAHPNGSHGFIKKAKISAANKNKKLFKDFLKKALGDI